MVCIVDKHIYLWIQPEYRGFVHIHVYMYDCPCSCLPSIHYDSLISAPPFHLTNICVQKQIRNR